MGSRNLTDDNTSYRTGRTSFDHTLASAQAGESGAFGELYEALNRRVRSFVALRGAADPDGMVNDVFLKAFTGISRFVGNEIQFQAWVFKIARNTLIDETRRRDRRLDETPLNEAHEVTVTGGDAESEAVDRLGDDWVLSQLDVLTSEQRDVVVLRVVSDLTIEAIAEVLDKQVGAVKALQRRAFQKLVKSFDGQAVPQ